jgi:hypothetical protein
VRHGAHFRWSLQHRCIDTLTTLGICVTMRYGANIQVRQWPVLSGIIYYLSRGNQQGIVNENKPMPKLVSTYNCSGAVIQKTENYGSN